MIAKAPATTEQRNRLGKGREMHLKCNLGIYQV